MRFLGALFLLLVASSYCNAQTPIKVILIDAIRDPTLYRGATADTPKQIDSCVVYAHGTGGSLIDDRIDRAWPIRYAVEGSAYYRQDPYGINSRGIKHGTLPIVNFANLLKGFGCNEDMPVFLKVCETAKGGSSFAKELSMLWRGPVVGADEKVWFSVNGADPTPHPMLDDDGPSRNINVMDTSIDGHYFEFVNGQFKRKISLQ